MRALRWAERGHAIILRPGFVAMTTVVALLWAANSCVSGTEPEDEPVAAVIVDAAATQLIVGDSLLLGVRLEDAGGLPLTGRAVAWSSANPGIASVSGSGLVRALGAGSAMISAASEGRIGSVSLTIIPAVAGVIVDPSADSLLPGDTARFTARVRDAAGTELVGRTVLWHSQNPAVASVSEDGLVTANATGDPVGIVATSEGRADTAVVWVGDEACARAAPIGIGETVTGTLDENDCRLSDEYADFWRFTTDSAAAVAIRMGGVVNGWLWLQEGNRTIAYSDTAIRIQLARGTYVIRLSGLPPQIFGSYSLAITHDPNAPGCAIPLPIDTGQTVAGTLTEFDCLLFDEYYADKWRLTLSADASLEFRARGSVFQPWLLVTDTSGVIRAQSTAGQSVVRVTLGAGVYDVRPASAIPFDRGDYELLIRRDPCSAAPLALGDTVTGTLSAADCAFEARPLGDPYRLVVHSSRLIRIDLKSADFDAHLVVTRDDIRRTIVATDDNGGDGSDARIESTFQAGTYLIWSSSLSPGAAGSYLLSTAVVERDDVNLIVDGAYLVQSAQRYDGTVPLVSGQPARVRVFGRATHPGLAAVPVRLRFYHNGVLADSITVPAISTTIPTMIEQSNASLSWNAVLPAALMNGGFSFSAEIDPDNVVAEVVETDNRWPAEHPRAVDVRSVRPLGLTYVPVLQGNGLLGSISGDALESVTDLTRKLYPLDTVELQLRSPYTTEIVLGDIESWGRLLSELELIRVAEDPSQHYYGIVKVSYPRGSRYPGGMATLPGRVAASVDAPNSIARLIAHELGHNFGRPHSPCGTSGGDWSYPYPDGRIGVYGWDRTAEAVISDTTADIMSYCVPQWISDYTFRRVMEYRDTATLAPSPPQPVLLVWGTVVDGRPWLEPSFHLTAPATPKRPGSWEVVVRDSSGIVLAQQSFQPADITSDDGPVSVFALAVPIGERDAHRVASIAVHGGTATAEQRSSRPGERLGTITDPTVRRDAAGATIRWATERYPAALVRDVATGRIRALVRKGELTVRPGEAPVELILSDGVRTRRVAP